MMSMLKGLNKKLRIDEQSEKEESVTSERFYAKLLNKKSDFSSASEYQEFLKNAAPELFKNTNSLEDMLRILMKKSTLNNEAIVVDDEEKAKELSQDPDYEDVDIELKTDESSVSGGAGPYNTPNAFSTRKQAKKRKKIKYASGLTESDINKMSMVNTKKSSTKQPKTYASSIDEMYEKMIEESYKSFATSDPKISPEQKVKRTIREVSNRLKEIENLVKYTSKMKTESGVSRTNYGPAVEKSLNKISERLIKISERVRSLGE